MRYYWLALATLFARTSLVFAQQPPGGSGGRLNGYVARWEKEMHNLQTLVVQCKRTEKDKTFPRVIFQGVSSS